MTAGQALEKENRRKQELKEEAELANYNPFGRGGGGAPMKDGHGRIVTDYGAMKSRVRPAQPSWGAPVTRVGHKGRTPNAPCSRPTLWWERSPTLPSCPVSFLRRRAGRLSWRGAATRLAARRRVAWHGVLPRRRRCTTSAPQAGTPISPLQGSHQGQAGPVGLGGSTTRSTRRPTTRARLPRLPSLATQLTTVARTTRQV